MSSSTFPSLTFCIESGNLGIPPLEDIPFVVYQQNAQDATSYIKKEANDILELFRHVPLLFLRGTRHMHLSVIVRRMVCELEAHADNPHMAAAIKGCCSLGVVVIVCSCINRNICLCFHLNDPKSTQCHKGKRHGAISSLLVLH